MSTPSVLIVAQESVPGATHEYGRHKCSVERAFDRGRVRAVRMAIEETASEFSCALPLAEPEQRFDPQRVTLLHQRATREVDGDRLELSERSARVAYLQCRTRLVEPPALEHRCVFSRRDARFVRESSHRRRATRCWRFAQRWA